MAFKAEPPTPQWRIIVDALCARIDGGLLAPGDRLPSEEEIATEFGVSRLTAHKSVQELQRRGLVQRRRRWGTVVAPANARAKNRIALLVDQYAPIYNFPHTDLLRAIEDVLGDEHSLVMMESKGDPDREARNLKRLAEEVDAILLYPTSAPMNTALIRRLAEKRPIVLLDRRPPELELDLVTSDNAEVTLTAIHALEARGHRRIAFFSLYKPEFSTVQERYEAYEAAMGEVGIPTPDHFARWFSREIEGEPRLFVQAVQDALVALTTAPEPVTAVFCVQDSLAAAVLEAAQRLEVSIPDRLEVTTFNDWPPMMLRRPWAVHRIVQDNYGMGAAACRRLLTRLREPQGVSATVSRVPAQFHLAEPTATQFSELATKGG
jgi:DNA-binding LacI/PurR family transcriptional regulator